METQVFSAYLLILTLFGISTAFFCFGKGISTAATGFSDQLSPDFEGVYNGGMFMHSKNSEFAFGLYATDTNLFSLVVLHSSSSAVVWTACRRSATVNLFEFEANGNAYLEADNVTVWYTDTAYQGVTVLKLQDNGNLVFLRNDGTTVWQSFSHPTDTLLSGQYFSEGMKLVSDPGLTNLSCYLEFSHGDLILSAGFPTSQPYWSLSNDSRKTFHNIGKVKSAIMNSNSWNFYDENQVLLWQFNFSDNSSPSITWAAKLSSQGSISFYNLQESSIAGPTMIPRGQSSRWMRISSSIKKHLPIYVAISALIVLIFCAALYLVFRCQKPKKKNIPEESLTHNDSSEKEDMNLKSIPGAPIWFRFGDLQNATDNFSEKLGRGGFGSVYLGVLADGTRVAVKKLEGIGQGMKEFQAEVSSIGRARHVHLVKLKGFCAEANHRLLVYEYMPNGSLDKWIFRKVGEDNLLDWGTRFNIALGMAKGLAYLHKECEVKIIHCDIKPGNVLLDSNFSAKVSDFGLAKLMTRVQSKTFTTLRGTRGYIAPEWIANNAISQKSDVFSFGMVLLEIIAGRKLFDVAETSEKAYLPSYAFKMMQEGTTKEILDMKLRSHADDERVITTIKVALWCIQGEVHLRPSMSKVVLMLEGLAHVPQPPTCPRLYLSPFKSSSEEGTSPDPANHNSNAYCSDICLSGPR